MNVDTHSVFGVYGFDFIDGCQLGRPREDDVEVAVGTHRNRAKYQVPSIIGRGLPAFRGLPQAFGFSCYPADIGCSIEGSISAVGLHHAILPHQRWPVNWRTHVREHGTIGRKNNHLAGRGKGFDQRRARSGPAPPR
jgi:hypothetical protein